MRTHLWFVLLCLCLFGEAFAQTEKDEPGGQTKQKQSVLATSNGETICEPNLPAHIYISPRKINKFTEELNRLGKCGYRLEKSGKTLIDAFELLGETESKMDFFGVMKSDAPHKYEYQWFEAYSPGQAQTRMNYRAAQGFYFKAIHPFQQIAENRDGDFADIATNKYRSIYGSILIFERRGGEIIKREYRVLDADGVGKAVKERNQDGLDELLRQDFHPVGFVKERQYFGIVMEKGDGKTSDSEYQILNYNLNLTKKLSELSKTGFLPEFLVSYVALLKKQPTAPFEQKTYKAFEDFEKLAADPSLLTNKYYLTTGSYYINGGDLKPKLLFVNGGKLKTKYQYKLLKMSAVLERAKEDNRFDAMLKPPTAEMLAEFQNLINQGYLVREVLGLKEIYILLERPVSSV